jgi:hypothetical protein
MSEVTTETTTETEVTEVAELGDVTEASEEATIATSEQIAVIESNAKPAEIKAALLKFTKANVKVIYKFMNGFKRKQLTSEQTNNILSDLINTEIGPDSTITEINNKIKKMKSDHGESLKQYIEIQQSTSKSLAKSLGEIFKNKGKSEVLIENLIKKLNIKSGNDELFTETELTDLTDLLRESMQEIDTENPDAKTKAEGKWGERGFMLLKLLGLIGMISTPILIGYILSKEYTGCYQFQTGIDQKKLTCSPKYSIDNIDKCSCGGVERNLEYATDEICQGDNLLHPYCACGKGTLPTCSSDISVHGGISYNYQAIGPLEALGRGIGEIGKGILDGFDLGDISSYIKYFIISIGVIFGIVIMLNILKYFVKKND